MARSPAEIQADIALTRRAVERQLDAVTRHVPRAWWTPYAAAVAALAAGVLLSRVPLLRLLTLGARTVQTGLTVAGTVSAVDNFVAERRRALAP
jgi:uncharacterized protein (DUF2062 family)